MLLTFGMVLATFQLEEKEGKMRFFQEIFLVANTAIEIVLEILFLTFNKMKINFANQELNLKIYILDEGLPTTKRV